MNSNQIKIFIIFITSIISLVSGSLSFKNNLQFASLITNTKNPTSTLSNQLINELNPQTQMYSLDNISTHNSPSDCWTVINNKIHNISSYVPFHPGGINTIITACGKDATDSFNSKGTLNQPHLPSTIELLNQYYLADLNSTIETPNDIPTTSINQLTPTPTVVTTSIINSSNNLITDFSTHNSSSDCWIKINNQIYNVTQYIPFHPGGTQQITNYCGKEATQAFNTRGGTGSHSSNAKSLLANYLLGNITTQSGTANPTATPTTSTPSTSTPTPTTAPQSNSGSYTTSEIATHNSQSNCWLKINNKIYNVTQYIPFHPGGTQKIVTYCGKEATQAFNTRGGSGTHSNNANNQLAGYFIGNLNTGSSAPTATPNPNNPNPTSTPTSNSTSNNSPSSAVLAVYPTAIITSIKTEDDGKSVVKFKFNGQNYEAKLDANNNIIKIEN